MAGGEPCRCIETRVPRGLASWRSQRCISLPSMLWLAVDRVSPDYCPKSGGNRTRFSRKLSRRSHLDYSCNVNKSTSHGSDESTRKNTGVRSQSERWSLGKDRPCRPNRRQESKCQMLHVLENLPWPMPILLHEHIGRPSRPASSQDSKTPPPMGCIAKKASLLIGRS